MDMLLQITARCMGTRRSMHLASAFNVLRYEAQLACQRENYVSMEARLELQTERLRAAEALALQASREHQSLKAAVERFTAEDAQVSASLASAAASSAETAQRAALRAAAAAAAAVRRRLLGVAFRKLQVHSLSFKSKVDDITASVVVRLQLSLGRLERCSLMTAWRCLHRSTGSDISASDVKVSPPTVSQVSLLDDQALSTQAAPIDVASAAQRLMRRADKLMRVKVRLSWHADFSQRCAASVSPTRAPRSELLDLSVDGAWTGTEEDLDCLRLRLDRGSACLIEYVLAASWRSRLRSAFNAFLAVAADGSSNRSTWLQQQRSGRQLYRPMTAPVRLRA